MGRFGINRDSYGFEIPDIYNNAASAAGFSAEYQTVYDSFIVKPAADIATVQDTMVRGLVASGVWAKDDAFYVTANNDRANSLINWINPGTYDLIEVNGPIAHVAYRGFTGDGVNQYLRTQVVLTAPGLNYVQNSAHLSIYTRTDVNELGRDIDTEDAAAHAFAIVRIGGNFRMRINDLTSLQFVNADSLGLHIVSRTAAGARAMYKNNALIGADATASTGLPVNEVFLLARNNAGVPANYTTKQACAASIGSGLTGVGNDVTNYTNALETYLDYVGAGVI